MQNNTPKNALGIPMPDFTKQTATDITEPKQTEQSLEEARKGITFAWSPEQTGQVVKQLRTRTQEETNRASRVATNVKTQDTKLETQRYKQLAQEEDNKIASINSEINSLYAQKNNIQNEIAYVKRQVNETISAARSINEQAEQMKRDVSSIVIPPLI